MFGIGLPEFAVIVVVGVLVFGPDKLPELARQAARLLKQGKQFADNARDELRSQLGPEYADLELRDLDPRSVVRRHITEAMAEDDPTDDEYDEQNPDQHDLDELDDEEPTDEPAPLRESA